MKKVTEIFVAAKIGLVGNAVNLAAYAVNKAQDQRRPVRSVIQKVKTLSKYPYFRSPWATSRERRI